MPNFVNYKPIEINTPKIKKTSIAISGPLDNYLAAISQTSNASNSESSQETPKVEFETFQWKSGGSKDKPYSYEYFTSTQNSNSSLAQALRQSADYAKAHAGSKTSHRCAEFVSNALEQSGITGFQRQHGWNYDKVTAQLGMQDITGQQTYKKGDIAVTKTNDGTGHVAICNRDGASINDKDAWSSDFNSSAHPYAKSRIEYARVFRAQQGVKLIKRNKQ